MTDWKEAALGSVGAIVTALGGALIFAQGVFEKLADKSLYLKAEKAAVIAQLKAEVATLQKQIDTLTELLKNQSESISTKLSTITSTADLQDQKMARIEGSIDALTHEDWEQEKKKIYGLHELQLKVNTNDFRLKALEERRRD